MGELWRDLVEILRRRPALWLPVPLADLLGYLLNIGRNSLMRSFIFHQTAQRSALGGAVVHTQLSASAMQSTAVIALLVSWLTYFLRILLYSAAFAATAALVTAFLDRSEKPASRIRPALAQHWSGILELTLRALAVYAVAALVLSSLSPWLQKHGQTALVRSPWFGYGLTLLVLLSLSALLAPVGLRVLAGAAPDRGLTRTAQQFSFALVTVASLLASFVGANGRQLAQIPFAARYPLEATGSLVVSLPYVLLFVGMSLLARRIAAPESEAATR